tara:strand:+ start:449 stop:562 length:114 start_codon:yes stop_codon:yes gene_type:complete
MKKTKELFMEMREKYGYDSHIVFETLYNQYTDEKIQR